MNFACNMHHTSSSDCLLPRAKADMSLRIGDVVAGVLTYGGGYAVLDQTTLVFVAGGMNATSACAIFMEPTNDVDMSSTLVTIRCCTHACASYPSA